MIAFRPMYKIVLLIPMRIPKFFFILLIASVCSAESTKTIFNPFTQKLDYITRIDSSTAITAASINLYDSSNCLWRAIINTAGAWVTSLVSCPTVTAFRACTPGVPYGLLLSITCPNP